MLNCSSQYLLHGMVNSEFFSFKRPHRMCFFYSQLLPSKGGVGVRKIKKKPQLLSTAVSWQIKGNLSFLRLCIIEELVQGTYLLSFKGSAWNEERTNS